MLRLILPLLAALTIALAACGGDDDATTSRTPTAAGAVTICGRIGVAGEATPATPTPIATCAPGADFIAPPGIRGAITETPDLPDGKAALTNYITFTTETPDINATVALPVTGDPLSYASSLAWYTYEDGNWSQVQAIVNVKTATGDQPGLATGDFAPLPKNLILLGG